MPRLSRCPLGLELDPKKAHRAGLNRPPPDARAGRLCAQLAESELGVARRRGVCGVQLIPSALRLSLTVTGGGGVLLATSFYADRVR